MKIVIIDSTEPKGFLSEDAIEYLKQQGYEDESWEHELPSMDLMKRNDPLLIETILLFGDQMSDIVVMDVVDGVYTILRVSEHYAREMLVEAGAYHVAEGSMIREMGWVYTDLDELEVSPPLRKVLLSENIYSFKQLAALSGTAFVKAWRTKLYREAKNLLEERRLSFSS